ncbi:MAG: FtsX-like permease family protein [Myxococcota bacterium]
MGVLLRWISLRRLLGSPARSLLVLFGIALGVAALAATLAVNASIRGAFTEMAERVAGKADLVVTEGDFGVEPELVEALDDVPEVEHVAGIVEAITQEPAADGPILVLGVDFLGDRYFLPLTGDSTEAAALLDDPIPFLNEPNAVLITRSFADHRGLQSGSSLPLITPDGARPMVVRGILKDEGLGRAFGGALVIMFEEAAATTFAERLARVEIKLKAGVDRDAAAAKISALIGSRARVEPPTGRAQHLTSILVPMERGMNVAGVLALLVGMFIIYNAVGVAVAERRREIGILRALGVTRRGIIALFSGEAAVLGILGSTLGVLLGRTLAGIAVQQAAPPVSRFYAPIHPPPPEITPTIAVFAFLVGMLATFFAALGPARVAATIDPAESLRRQAASFTRRPLPARGALILGLLTVIPAWLAAIGGSLGLGFLSMGLFAGSGLLMIPALILGLRRVFLPLAGGARGLVFRVALDNAERRLDRSALTAGALMLAVSASVALGTWAQSLEVSAFKWLGRALPADLYITAGSPTADQHNIPFRPEVMETLRGIPGVRHEYPVRRVSVDIGDKRLMLFSFDTATWFQAAKEKGVSSVVLAGPDPIPPDTLASAPNVLLSENAARKLGIQVGESLELSTPTGARRFRVAAVILDYASDLGAALIDRRWFMEYYQDDLVDTVDFVLDEKAEISSVEAAVKERLGPDRALFIVSAAELRREIQRVLDDSIAVFRSTELIALWVALLGVIGSMLAAVLDRTREIGVLRALGSTRGQILRFIVAEAAFLGLAAAVGGVIAGIPIGYVFVHSVGLHGTGWLFDYYFPAVGALRVSVLVILTAAAAGVWPGRRAARLSVTEALAYE